MEGVSELPGRWDRTDEPSSEVSLADKPGGLERPRPRGLELSPEEKIARRHNRRWLLGIAVPTIIVLVLALLASGKAEKNQPNGPSISAPAGYQVHRDGYFSYVVPAGWTDNIQFTDSTGDVDTSGSDGWAAEHIGYRTGPPVIGEAQPASLRAFGISQPQPYQLIGGHPVAVPGADVAFAYTMVRPGFRADVVDAWSSRSSVEIWLVIHASDAVSARIIGSLAG